MKLGVCLIAVLLLTAIPAMAAVDASVASAGTLKIELLKYEPIPTHPGDVVDIWVKLDNTGGDIQKNVQLEFLDNYPFTLESDERRVHDIGALSGGYDYVAKFKARVDPAAPVGTSFIKARYKYISSGRFSDIFLDIDIESQINSLSIQSISTTPERIEPGQEGIITVKIKNIAQSTLRDIVAKLDLTSSDAPLAPVGSSTEIKIPKLDYNEEYEFQFKVLAELNAEANAYTIPLDLSFKDDTGGITEYDELVGVLITAEPDLVVTVDSSDIYSDDPTGALTLQFVNKGVDEIKFVYINLLPSDSYDLLSPTTNYYVGNIDTDDYEIEEIVLRANDKNSLEIPMEIEYRDAANKPYKIQETLKINLVKKEEIEGKKSGSGKYIIVLLILGGAGFYYYKKRR